MKTQHLVQGEGKENGKKRGKENNKRRNIYLWLVMWASGQLSMTQCVHLLTQRESYFAFFLCLSIIPLVHTFASMRSAFKGTEKAQKVTGLVMKARWPKFDLQILLWKERIDSNPLNAYYISTYVIIKKQFMFKTMSS